MKNPEEDVSAQRGIFGIHLRQWVKIVVYGLLFLNFFHYLGNDLEVARHTVHDGWTLIDYTTAFATTLDESAWFMLLLLFELETYLLSDEAFTPRRVMLMHAIRVVCILFIAHTVYAFGDAVWKLGKAEVYTDTSLCVFTDRDLSFAWNLEYTELSADNCADLSNGGTFHIFEKGQLITDDGGMRVEKQLAWIDLLEVVVWLIILFMIEYLVRLQERGVTSGPQMRAAQWVKAVSYGLLWCCALYWGFRGHWVFVWDEALWILGFMAIGMNLSDWREEIDAEAAVDAMAGGAQRVSGAQ